MSNVNPLYEQRLLIFLEDIGAGVFNQVLLNKKQFKRVSDAIIVDEFDDGTLREGFKTAEIIINEVEIPADVFIGCSSVDDFSPDSPKRNEE